jgi:hypothetical protein
MIQNIEKFLYHGSFYDNIDLSKAEYKECLFLTPNIRYALSYSGVDEDFEGYVFEYRAKENLNIFNAADSNDREALLAAFPEYKKYIDDMAKYEWLECIDGPDVVADQKKIISDISSLGYDGYFNFENNSPIESVNDSFGKNLGVCESFCIFALDKIECIKTYEKDEIEENDDFKQARKEDEKLFKKEIKEYFDMAYDEDKIIDLYENEENRYITIPMMEAIDIIQDTLDELNQAPLNESTDYSDLFNSLISPEDQEIMKEQDAILNDEWKGAIGFLKYKGLCTEQEAKELKNIKHGFNNYLGYEKGALGLTSLKDDNTLTVQFSVIMNDEDHISMEEYDDVIFHELCHCLAYYRGDKLNSHQGIWKELTDSLNNLYGRNITEFFSFSS